MKVDELKEWRLKYAGMAMQGILSNVEMLHSAIDTSVKMNMSLQTVIAKNALSYADRLIKELAGDNIELSPVKTEDSDLKSLKDRVQPKQEWSEEDENFLNTTIAYLRDAYSKDKIDFKDTAKNCVNWLKSLKYRVQPQPKQEWSEEDEKRIKKVMHILSLDGRISNKELERIFDWLKSLKPHSTWKPSEEQMKSLQEVIDAGHYTSYPNSLETLYEELKKLKG